MCKNKLNIEAINHFNSFIDEFVPHNHKKRWKALLNFKKPRYDDIKPYDIWPDNNEIKNCSILNNSFYDLIHKEPYKKIKDKMVVVIPCGHDDNQPSKVPLKEIVNSNHNLLEGLISIIEGKLVLLVNHDGEVCIFKK